MMGSKLRVLGGIALPAFCLYLTLVATAGTALAQGGDAPFVSGQLQIQGNRLTLYADELTTDADQTINLGERAQVRTCFGGPSVACGSVQPGDPRIAGLIVQAELRGPELPQALEMTTVPGGAFILPGFQQEGDYRLENIRLVSEATGQVLGLAEPSVAVLHVREIVLARATVTTLSLEDLRQRGIALNEENFQAFNFAVGFALEGEIVEIEFPVVYSGNGVLNPVAKPKIMLDNLPPDTIATVGRWKPPNIIPFRLEEEERELLDVEPEGEPELSFPMFGAIVIPGTVTFLNQFFDAKLIVANAGPAGSGVELHQLRGAIRLPGGNVLRMAATEPPVAPGQPVPIVAANGGRVLRPGEQGTASWTIEGLRPGTHSVFMDIEGDLVRPGRDPLPIRSVAQAAVEVVDARFNLTFSHPDVVREGEEYTLFVTVNNLSQQTQNLVSVELKDENMTGARFADPDAPTKKTIETLEPGQSETIEFELESLLNGKVIATTFQSDSSNLTGTIQLRAGVGELGIPLSPATLVMPRFTEFLDPPYTASDELVKSHVRLLGLAYSLAVAPSGQIPPGVPRVIRSDVERRAVDLAEAGQRVYLQEQMLETLEALALDQLGNRHALDDFDALRRRTDKGLRAASRWADQVRLEQIDRGLDAVDLFDHFGETTSYARPYMAALLVPDAIGPAPELEITKATSNGLQRLSGPSTDEDGAVRTLPWAELYGVHAGAAEGSGDASLALVGRVALDEVFRIVVTNPHDTAVRGRLILIVPDSDTRTYRRLDFGTVSVPARGSIAVDAGAPVPDPSSGGFRPFDGVSGAPIGGSPIHTTVPLPPFRVIGARQDFRINEEGPDRLGNMIRPNRYGAGLSYLFNRPPDRAAAENPDHWALRSSFDGLDVLGDPASGEALKTGSAAFYQENSERVVNVRFTGSVAAMINPETNQPLVEHVQELDTNGLIDEFGNPLDPTIPTPVVERVPVHVGGLVDGRVVRGTGDPVPGAKVQLIRPRWVETLKGPKIKLDLAGTTTTDDDGRFFFEYVENPNWDRQVDRSFVLRATVPAGDDPELEPEEIQEVSSVIRQQNRMAHVNIALLGRGHLTGKLVYLDDQSPAKKGRVTAASTLFREEKTVQIEADGSFRIPGMPVGPITLTGRDEDGRKVYATVGIAEPGDTVDVHLEIQRQTAPVGEGTVVGRVMQRRDGELYPATGARVACYSEGRIIGSQTTDDDGLFRFDGVPEGRVSLQARDWRISRTAAFTDLILTDGEIAEVELLLFDGGRKTVTGEVFFRDPFTQELLPIEGAVAFIGGPGNFAYTDASGRYTIEDVPTQGVSDNPWQLTVIDFERQLQGRVGLPPILENTPDPIVAQSIVLEEMEGSVSGVVLDPLGRPAAGVGVVLLPYAETFTGPDGSFLFEDIPTGNHTVTAHSGDGLTPGRVGWIGAAKAEVVFGGHRPFVQIRMRGAGKVRIKTRTATSTGILTPIFWRPTYYSETAKAIVLAGAFTEDTTDPNGNLELDLPVGEFEIVAFNPFHGIKEINGQIEYAGQVKDLDILFEDAATVKGVVVDVDGVTPVPDVEVELHTKTLLPQKQRTNALGEFQYELVPEGPIEVRARGFVGTVERVGRTLSGVQLGGYTYELTVQMKAQGTVKGQVKETVNGTTTPLAFARYFVRENSYPFRRIPQDGSFLLTDDQGRYQVSHIYAGRVTVVAQDSFQVTRQGSTNGEITADWQVATMDDIVMKTSVGRLEVLVRDPDTGGPVADTQIRLSNKEWTTTGADGVGVFEALPLGTYSIYAFHAPTGRAGTQSGLKLTGGGQTLKGTVFLDIRGEVRGTLYDDAAKTAPVPGGIVRLVGRTPSGRVEGLATTSGRAETLGRFSFGGIPEGQYSLTAALQSSPRRASASVGITDTAPIADIDMVLEPIGDLYFRLYEKLTAGTTPLVAENGLFSVRVTQASVVKPRAKAYDFTRLAPEPGTDLFYFPDVLTGRGVSVTAQEQGAELRKASLSISKPLDPPSSVQGDGSAGDPFRLTLSPKGAVRITVLDGGGELLEGANVTLWTSGGRFPSVTDDEGTVVFRSVPAGGLTAYAENPFTGFGGTTRSRLDFDDQTVEILVQLQPAVSASGRIFAPTVDDRPPADASELVPAPGMIVTLRDSQNDQHLVFTDDDGFYRFPVLPTGGYSLSAQDNNGTQKVTFGGSLSGPNGNENVIPDLILDASPPRVVSITPPPGIEGVSRLAPVEIVFTEPLATNILPGSGGNRYYTLVSANGIQPTGVWSHRLDGGRQVIRFVPSSPYENETTYTLTIDGESNGVKDRAGRQLTQFGNVGANFTTSDSVGPTVIGTEPTLDRPVDPTVPLRIDFSEGLSATDELLDGDGVDDAATLEVLKGDGTWVELPVVLFLTRQGYSLQVEPIQGLEIPDDTLRRRLTVSGLLDSVGNPMNPWVATFRIYDENTPGLAIGPPANAPDGQLVQGVSYTLQPVLSNLDDLDLGPGGDIDSVDYFFEDPEDPTSPVQPNFSAREHPFTYTFVGAYAGDGIEPRLFPVWVRVVDTSTNASDFVKVDMQVLPNTPPTIDGALLDVLSPIAGTLYAGSTVRATADGIDDVDGSRLTVSLAVFREDETLPIGETGGVLILRPDGGWDTLDPPFQSFTIDLDVPEGTPIYSRVRVIDSQGAIAEVESERVLVADDTEPPTVDSVVARRVADNSPQLVFFIGETLRLEWRARDGETDVSSVEVTFDRDDIFPAPITATRVSGDLFRTEVLSVPPDLFFEPTSVVATIAADDYGGNTGERTLTFEVAPEPDPTAPVATWRSPWQGGEWPAAYESTTLTGATDLLLRAWITDISLDDADQEVPGTIVDVRFRGPVQTADGGFELAEQWAAAELVTGTDAPGEGLYELLWWVDDDVPAGTELPFAVRAVDSGGLATVSTITLTATPARRVFEGTQTSVLPTNDIFLPDGDLDGPVFLLDGALVSLFPKDDGSERRIDALYVYAGGHFDGEGALVVDPTIFTAPETTSYDSAIRYTPFALHVDRAVGVGHGARLDVDGRGLLGSTRDRSLLLPGMTRPGTYAGGSHGGLGWVGSTGGGWNGTLTDPNAVYDNLRIPSLPGTGGTSNTSGSSIANGGGHGGGVLHLFAGTADVRLEGSLRARGLRPTRTAGGGAGGAIRLDAGTLSGAGTIDASGGRGNGTNRSGGGGGGRIAVRVATWGADFDPVAQVLAAGGLSGEATRRAGAGTIHLATLDAEGLPIDGGHLLVANPASGLESAFTPLPALGEATVSALDVGDGTSNATLTVTAADLVADVAGERIVIVVDATTEPATEVVLDIVAIDGTTLTLGASLDSHLDALTAIQTALVDGPLAARGLGRFGSIEAIGDLRLIGVDAAELGPEGATALDDRTHVTVRDGARVLLGSEGPSASFAAVPEAGDVRLGSTIQLEWTANDAMGIVEVREHWSVTGDETVRALPAAPLDVTHGDTPIALAIPLDLPPGPVTYTVSALDGVGRSAVSEITWNVLPNALPISTVSPAVPDQTTARAGYPVPFAVHAEDLEGLASVTLVVIGPATPASQTLDVTGFAADLEFTVTVDPAAVGDVPLTVQAVIIDNVGDTAPSAPLALPIVPNDLPTGTLTLADGAAAVLKPTETTTLLVHAEDPDGLSSIELVADGPVEPASQSRAVSGQIEDASFDLSVPVDAVAGPVAVTAILTDRFGATTTLGPLAIEVLANATPTVTVTLPDGASNEVDPGADVAIDVRADDEEALARVTLRAVGPVTPSDESRDLTGTSALERFTLEVDSDAQAGSPITVTAEVEDAFGNPVVISEPLALTVAADSTPPVASIAGVAAVYRSGTTLSATITATDDIAVERVEVTFDGTTTTLTTPTSGSDYLFEVEVDRAITTARDTAVEVVAFDPQGNASATASVPVQLIPDLEPTIGLTVLPDLVVLAGTTIEVRAALADDVVVESVTFRLSGAVTAEETRLVGAASATESFFQMLPTTLAGGDTITVTVEADDNFGHVSTATTIVTSSGDGTPPEMTLDLDPVSAGDVYTAGDTVTLTATATDDVEITSFDLRVDGEVLISDPASPSLLYVWTAPPVAETTVFVLEARAVDPEGNVGSETRPVTVEPLANADAPTVRFDCPTTGATLPGAELVTLAVSSTDDLGVATIELFRDDETTPFAVVAPDVGTDPALAGSVLDTLPSATGGGTTVRYRAVATDAALNVTETEITIHVVEVVDLDAAAPDWSAVETAIAVLRTGTLSVDQPRTLGGLIVLDGASITHPLITTGAETAIDLTIDGPVYVACGGSIDATGRGYGPSARPAGATGPGGGSGGSHIGEGGSTGNAVASTYGNVYEPTMPGGGGQHGSDGDRGGGVIHLTAKDRLVVDGGIVADGQGTTGYWTRGGAGGSVWIEVDGVLSGGGSIEADGGASEGGNQGSGGGGAVSLDVTSVDDDLLTRVHAYGGTHYRAGGPGSVLIRRAGQTHGDLVIDADTASGRPITLPELGAGVAGAGSGGAFLEIGSDAAPWFVGHRVEVFDGTTGAFEGLFRVAETVSGALVLDALAGGPVPTVDPGDLWQGAYHFDSLGLRGSVTVSLSDPIRIAGEAEVDGVATLEALEAGSMRLRAGSIVHHPAITDTAAPRQLVLDLAGDLVIEAGASIDLSGRGYQPERTLPGETAATGSSGGSHIGVGGLANGTTYGSVYRPREAGAGGGHRNDGDPGGGVLRLFAEDLVLLDPTSAIRANGTGTTGYWTRGGAGGSIWMTLTGGIQGGGVIEARGGASEGGNQGSGGGGAIAIEYGGSLSTAAVEALRAWGGDHYRRGGAGSIYLHGPSNAYGDLILDAGSVVDGRTTLPSLGGGSALAGSGGVVLVTDRATIQPTFTGHWIEVRDANGTLRGMWRIASIDGGTLTLEADGASVPAVVEGDTWHGIYRVDDYSVRGDLPVTSVDPIRVQGIQEIAGDVEVREIVAGGLILRSGARLSHPATTDPAAPETLTIELSGDLVIEAGAEIDVTAKGLKPDTTYPGETLPGGGGGGSHIGRGGRTAGSTYGSVYFPREPGGGGQYAPDADEGGGVVRIVAQNLVVDDGGAIRANGLGGTEYWVRGGAGGSIWITLSGTLSGDGLIEARGGRSDGAQQGSGGGGAIAIEHQGASGAVIDNLIAYGGERNHEGGAGSVFVHGPSSTYGDLTIDNSTIAGAPTELPSLGGGTALAGSTGGTLVTDRAAIQPYFVGHWIEVSDASGQLEGTYRVASIDGGTLGLVAGPASGAPQVDPGDTWQGVYAVDNYSVSGSVQVISADPIRVAGSQVLSGSVQLREIVANGLILRPGTILTHPPTSDPNHPESLRIELTGDLVLEDGAAIDVTGKGFVPDTTYPGESTPTSGGGGSHMGRGGRASGSTYGSVYTPQEPGGGGQYAPDADEGGGVVRIIARGLDLQGTSAIRANGRGGTEYWVRGGAGGSIWISLSGTLSGDGTIEARGGRSDGAEQGSGGGGAIAIEYGAATGTVLDNVRTYGGERNHEGGAGTIVLVGPSATYGELLVDNGTVVGAATELPSLGSGVAGATSGGATLDTGRDAIPPYFIGHWVEIYDPAGAFEGVFRIAAVGSGDSAGVVTLAADGPTAPSVDAGDTWQGVYRFDDVTIRGTVPFTSPDPVLVDGTWTIDGAVTLQRIDAGDLVLAPAATLTQPPTGSGPIERLTIDLSGDVHLGAGSAIDVSAKGFAPDHTYPGASLPGGGGGGSHIGRGGLNSGTTYGSVTFPAEPGGGGQYALDADEGGGVLRLIADDLVFETGSAIRANGLGATEYWVRGGAGGSIWITLAGTLSGDGSIEAIGGPSAGAQQGSGGGGAIAIYHRGASGPVLDSLMAWGGANHRRGGTGSIVVHGPTSTYGDLILDSSTVIGADTVLPALGSGFAAAGSTGQRVVTDRTVIGDYFVGHWVEILDAVTGDVRGTWRIAALDLGAQPGVDPVTLVLDGSGAALQPGDGWRGVYRFDNVRHVGQVNLVSDDPVRVTGETHIAGTSVVDEVVSGSLRIVDGGVLTQPLTSSTATHALTIDLTGDLTVEVGGAIDVSGRGYRPSGGTYPGASPPGGSGGGSHLGRGGHNPGTTFDSVYRPIANGGAGEQVNDGDPGGGAVRVDAENITIDGAIRADGSGQTGYWTRGGAGGAIWLTARSNLGGDGQLSAAGGRSEGAQQGSGGGGAIALWYGTTTGTIADATLVHGGDNHRRGGAGTVYRFDIGDSVDGDLLVDNASVVGQDTDLPSLGSGTAAVGTAGASLVTDRTEPIPAFFVGHWIEVRDAGDSLRGRWRIGAITDSVTPGDTMELVPNGAETISLLDGFTWSHQYRFDSVTVTGSARLTSLDPVFANGQPLVLPLGATTANPAAPDAVASAVKVVAGSLPGGYRVEVGAGAFTDADGIVELRLEGGDRSVVVPWDGHQPISIPWLGRAGERLSLIAVDGHGVFGRSRELPLAPLPPTVEIGETAGIERVGAPPIESSILADEAAALELIERLDGTLPGFDPSAPIHGAAVDGDLLAVRFGGTLAIWDVADPSAPRLVGRLDGVARRGIAFVEGSPVLYAPDDRDAGTSTLRLDWNLLDRNAAADRPTP